MFKQALMLIVFSVIAIVFKAQLAEALRVLLFLHTQIAHGLGVIFAFDRVGEIVQSVIALLIIPMVIAIIFAVAHFFIRQAHFPHTITMVWIFWAVLLTSLLSHTVYTHHMVSEDVHLMHENSPMIASHDDAPAANDAPMAAPSAKEKAVTAAKIPDGKTPPAVTQGDQSLPAAATPDNTAPAQ